MKSLSCVEVAVEAVGRMPCNNVSMRLLAVFSHLLCHDWSVEEFFIDVVHLLKNLPCVFSIFVCHGETIFLFNKVGVGLGVTDQMHNAVFCALRHPAYML